MSTRVKARPKRVRAANPTDVPIPLEYPETAEVYFARMERIAREDERARMERAADDGRWLKEREDDTLDATLVGPAVEEFLSVTLASRLEQRECTVAALQRIRSCGCEVTILDGAARIAPLSRLPQDLARWLNEPMNRASLEDLLDEREEAACVAMAR
ncbi:MAG: hypothetical protein C0467_06040 [Planctomycetaceae bacterium]|nr:hypothetical protein [Planctomycetaceae bacterium]